MDAYYRRDGDRFLSGDLTRGPWSPDHQHGGPPAALLARACAPADPTLRLARLGIELLRPIPLRPLRVTSETITAGKTTERVVATLSDGDVVVARALGLRVRTEALDDLPSRRASELGAPPAPEASTPFTFDFFRWPIGYHTSIELRLARGRFREGPVVMWMRPLCDLVEGEPMTPLDRLFVCADSASGVSQILDPHAWSFVNADLTVHLHRLPAGDWIGLEAHTLVEADGLGLCESRIWDAHGHRCGRGAQTLVVRRVPGATVR